jgi:hypothetical protein
LGDALLTKPNHRHRLLRARRERPRARRTAEQRDEFAPFHSLMPPMLPTERIAHLIYGRRLLRCGISIHAMTAQGRTQSFGDVGSNVWFARKRTCLGDLCVRALLSPMALSRFLQPPRCRRFDTLAEAVEAIKAGVTKKSPASGGA